MQDIRKKHSISKSNFPISRSIEPRSNNSISHIGISGEDSRRPRYVQSDDVSYYRTAREEREEAEQKNADISLPHRRKTGSTGRKIKSIMSFAFFAFVFFSIFYALTFVFDRATVVVTPNYRDITLSGTSLTIGNNAQIPFEVVTSEASKTKTLPKTTTTTVDKKASGEITIYNNFSTSPQRLVKFTRFESSKNKIYKIPESVVVPGSKDGKPGELVVKVYAESEGAEYNIDSDVFTIPGFKGKGQFTKIYAKSKSQIVGGSSGSKAIVAIIDLNAAKDELALNIRENIKKDLAVKSYDKKVPILDSLVVTITDNSAQVLSGEADTYSAKGVGSIAIVDESTLSKVALGGDVNKSLSYHFVQGKDFAISVDKNTPLLASTTLSLSLTGNSRIIWSTDYNALQSSLVAKTKKEFTTLISDDKTISSATLSLFPPWKSSFPSRKESINVKEKLPEYK